MTQTTWMDPLGDFNVLAKEFTPKQIMEMWDELDLDPVYQRQPGVWDEDAKQFLIDTMLNGYIVPALYLHEYPRGRAKSGKRFTYGVIDGKQRLGTIHEFLTGRLRLAEDFEMRGHPGESLGSLSFQDLLDEHPDLATRFERRALMALVVRTSDDEIVEEMFVRLNESSPLNAAEKRNGKGGPGAAAIRKLAEHEFFKRPVLPLDNHRYRHLDLAAKFMAIELKEGHPAIKKPNLDRIVEDAKLDAKGAAKVAGARDLADVVLESMCKIFRTRDSALSQAGMVPVLYLYTRNLLLQKKKPAAHLHEALDQLSDLRIENRRKAEKEGETKAKSSLLEFDRLMQGNDPVAFQYRLLVVEDFLANYDPATKGRSYLKLPDPSHLRPG